MTQAQAIEQSQTTCTGTKDFTSTLAGWLRVFSRAYRRDLISEDSTIYAEALCDLTAEQLNAACRKAIQTCKFFPTIAEIREQLEKAEEKGFELEAEREWENLLEWVRENYYPDPLTVGNVKTHIRPEARRLPAATQHAARAGGGYSYIERCSQDALVWCRKSFLAAYKNAHEIGQVEHLLSDGEAKRLWEEMKAGPRALRPGNAEWENKYPPPAMPANPKPIHIVKRPEITEEEWDRRKRDQKERAAAWIVAHPEVQKPAPEHSKNPSAPEVASA